MSIDWGNTLPSGDHPISELKHFKTLKRLVDYLEELPQGKKVLLISDTRLAFTNIVVDFLAVTPAEFLEARLADFLLTPRTRLPRKTMTKWTHASMPASRPSTLGATTENSRTGYLRPWKRGCGVSRGVDPHTGSIRHDKSVVCRENTHGENH